MSHGGRRERGVPHYDPAHRQRLLDRWREQARAAWLAFYRWPDRAIEAGVRAKLARRASFGYHVVHESANAQDGRVKRAYLYTGDAYYHGTP